MTDFSKWLTTGVPKPTNSTTPSTSTVPKQPSGANTNTSYMLGGGGFAGMAAGLSPVVGTTTIPKPPEPKKVESSPTLPNLSDSTLRPDLKPVLPGGVFLPSVSVGTTQIPYLPNSDKKYESNIAPSQTSNGFVPPPPTQQVPDYKPAIPVMDIDSIRKYAQEQVAAKLKTLDTNRTNALIGAKTTADNHLNAINTQAQRLKTTIGEDRALADVSNQRNLSPYSGKSDYAQGIIGMNRERSDREMNQDIASRQAQVNQGYADFEMQQNNLYKNLADQSPEMIEAMIQQMKGDERNYDLNVAQQTINGLLANSQLNQADFARALQTFSTNRGVFESDRSFNYNKEMDAINQARANKLDNWGAYKDFVGMTGDMGTGPKQDWGLFDLGGNRSLQGQQFDWNKSFQQQEAKRQELQDQRQNAYNWSKLSQDQSQFNQELALKQQQQSQGLNDDIKRELSGLNAGLSSGKLNALDASREVDFQLKSGLITPEAAAQMKSFIQKWTEEQQPVSKNDGPKLQTSPNNFDGLSMEQLAALWETDPTGRAAGRPVFDWRSWIMDPNGFKAGNSFELWKSKYGPVLGGR